ncbi:hypothetical protein F4677DRAFT_419037 [Hypoxylon crocopeplum]|nr:hypothetical protein F4677DRAFT_419037 [Hypoxylon crocopeplum]
MKSPFTLFAFIHASTWLFGLVSSGSIAAWTTGLGAPQIIMQDDATGKIFYSLCNSNGSTPIFPANESAAFTFDSDNLAPKNGTSLAGIGYYNEYGTTAAIWYQNNENQIIHALWNCENGLFVKSGDQNQWPVSSGLSVHSDTGLMAVNLGADAGYRVYYHDESMATSFLHFTSASGWSSEGYLSQDIVQCFPIGAGFTDTNKITVVMGRGPVNIEVTTLQQDGTWVITTFPTPLNEVDRDDDEPVLNLPVTNNTATEDFSLNTTSSVNWSLDGWDGEAGGIGFTLDHNSTRNIFYIGNDSLLHHVSEVNGAWGMSSSLDIKSWPRADVPNAQFATVFDFGRDLVWIYYMSDGNMTQVYQSSKDEWEPASALLKYNNTAADSGPVDRTNTGLSTGSKAGIGVGASVGGIILIALGAYIFIQRKKGERERKQADAEAAAAAAANQPPPPVVGSPAPAYSSGVEGHWIDGQWVSYQPSSKPEQSHYSFQSTQEYQPMYHEMPNQEHTHEMLGDVARRELPATHNETEEVRP